MKCPKCGINLLEHIDVCPFCKTPIPKDEPAEQNSAEETAAKAEKVSKNVSAQNTGRYSSIDPSKDSYDFDLQYTLTFRDSGEIKQAIADMDAEISRDSSKKKISTPHKTTEEPRFSREEMQEAALESAAAQRTAQKRRQEKGFAR